MKTTLHVAGAMLIVAVTSSTHVVAEGLSGDKLLSDKGGAGCAASNGLCLDVFFAGDAWKMKADDDDNNNFGFRTGLNSSFGDWNGIRGQLGASIGGYDFYGREDANEQGAESQVFVTAGAYKRADLCCGERVSWGIVWDFMSGDNWGEDADSVNLNQVRYLAGYALNDCNEIGFMGAWGIDDDTADQLNNSVVEAIDQYNVYWRRDWEFGGETMIYTGIADDRYDLGQWIVGFKGRVPLSHRTSLFGGVQYIIPSTSPGDTSPNGVSNSYSEETWNVSFGLVWTFGSGSCCGQNYPLLPVADNGSFAVAAPTGSL